MKTFFNHTAKHDDSREKSKSQHEVSAHALDQNWGNLPSRDKRSQSSLQVHSEPSGRNNIFTPLRLPINKVLNSIKHQLWVRRPRPIRYDPTLFGTENIAPILTARDTRSSTIGPSGSTERAHPRRFLQRVHPYSRSSIRIRIAKHSAYPATILDHPIQSNRVIPHF